MTPDGRNVNPLVGQGLEEPVIRVGGGGGTASRQKNRSRSSWRCRYQDERGAVEWALTTQHGTTPMSGLHRGLTTEEGGYPVLAHPYLALALATGQDCFNRDYLIADPQLLRLDPHGQSHQLGEVHNRH